MNGSTVPVASFASGDLREWVESLPLDDRWEIFPHDMGVSDEAGPSVLYARIGATELLVKPQGDGTWSLDVHSHTSLWEAVKCFRKNQEENQRRIREFEQDPRIATMRAMAERAGMPIEIVDQMLPMDGSNVPDGDPSEALQRLMGNAGGGRHRAITVADDCPDEQRPGFYL